jgi:hypothetical protein
MSAFGGKADICSDVLQYLLLTQSGYHGRCKRLHRVGSIDWPRLGRNALA